MHDGLYWPDDDGPEGESPFGPLVSRAERYLDTREAGDPFFGYYLQVLTRRGATGSHPGYDYRIDGRMVAGFGMVAYPAEHGVTGVMTFVVDQRGKVYEKGHRPLRGDVRVRPGRQLGARSAVMR